MVSGAKKEEKKAAVAARKAPSTKKKSSPSKKKSSPAATPTTKKKNAKHLDADFTKDSSTLTGGAEDSSMKAKRKSAPTGGGKMDKISRFLHIKKGSGAAAGKTAPRKSRKELSKHTEMTSRHTEMTSRHTEMTSKNDAPTAESVQSENSGKTTGTAAKMGKSRGRKATDKKDKEKAKSPSNNRNKRDKPSAKKATTPKDDSKEDSKEPTLDIDDEGETKLIVVERGKLSGKKSRVPATTPQHEVERKEREGNKGGNMEKPNRTSMVTARKKGSGGGAGAITMYDTGQDKALAKLASLRDMESRGWEECERDFLAGHRINPEVNRATRYVISFNVPPDGDFYDANKVEIPGVDTKFILAAAPTMDVSSRENFWRMVYDSNVVSIFFLEKYDASASNFVPWKAGEAKDYGKMFVNNKKVTESKKDGMQSVLEVLPEGCSNSIIVRFVQCLKWPETMHRDTKRFSELNHPTVFTRLLKDEKGLTMVMCSSGCGKSAQFVMLHSAITTLNNLNPTPLYELLVKVRQDRWGAIQTLEQYLAVYQLLIYYMSAKSKHKSEVSNLCNTLIKTLTVFKK